MQAMRSTEQHGSQDFLVRLHLVREQLAGFGDGNAGAQKAVRLLRKLESRLQRPPRIIILGETNSGKTTLANRLMGCEFLATDIVRNTRTPTILKYAASSVVHVLGGDGSRHRVEDRNIDSRMLDNESRIEVGLPLECLQTFEIIDTPGSTLADATEQRGATAGRIVHVSRSAHVAIWCTVASQAWRASEIAHWERLRNRAWLQNILCVTHADRLDSADREKVRHRLVSEAGHMFQRIVMSPETEQRGHVAVHPDGMSGEAVGAEQDVWFDSALGAIERHRYRRAGQVVHRFLEDLEIPV